MKTATGWLFFLRKNCLLGTGQTSGIPQLQKFRRPVCELFGAHWEAQVVQTSWHKNRYQEYTG
jgi:hypothetical protein